MPRSSRHKSGKHGSKEAREYSDSEKDLSLKDKKPRDDSVICHGSRESASGEKRKCDTKAVEIKEFIDFVDEYSGSSSKKRKEKGGVERWTGDVNESELVKPEKDVKGVGDYKSRSTRWDDSPGFTGIINEGKRNVSKAESKHHRSERKERGDRDGLDREKKSKDHTKSQRFLDVEAGAEVKGVEGSRKHLGEDHSSRDVAGNTGMNVQDDILNPDDEREVDRRVRRKKDSDSDVDRNQDMIREFDDRCFPSKDDRHWPAKDDIAKLVIHKEDVDKDERHKDKSRDDAEKNYYHQEEKHPRDSRHAREYTSIRFDDKYSNSRIEKKNRDTQLKKSKPHDGERDDGGRYPRCHDDRDRDEKDHETDHDRDNDRERGLDHDKERGRDVDWDPVKDTSRDRERGKRDREKDVDRDRHRERYRRERELERDRTRDRDHDNDWDYGSHVDRRSSGYREDRSRRRSPDDFDDYYSNERPKRVKADADTDRERSITYRPQTADAVAGSSRGRSSPSSKSNAYADKYRDNMLDVIKYSDSTEGTGFPETPVKYSKYHYADKHAKLDDCRNGDPTAEISPATKASSFARNEKSPSTSIDRKYTGRLARRRSIDAEEAERRSCGSNDVIEGPGNDDRPSRDMTSKRSMGEDYSPAESSFPHKPGHGNWSSLGHGLLNYRAGADSPFTGLMGEDSRGHSGRYRRSVDPNVGRPHGNPWKVGVPHWASPISNGFMHFPLGPHGPPPHGGFPGMISQFQSPLFGPRPPMELNHAGIPYHLPDHERFTGHLRPAGWQNIMDGMGPPFHGWDASNSFFRDEIPFYGLGNMTNGRPREAILEHPKQIVDMMNMEATPMEKDVNVMKSFEDEARAAQCSQEPGNGSQEDKDKVDRRKISSRTQHKDAQEDRCEETVEETPELAAVENVAGSLNTYLSKLDVSTQLTDPDLYNEYMKLAIFEQSDEVVEDTKENMQGEEALVSDILLEADTSLQLPVAEDSIFQRAMDLYKSQSFVRGTFASLRFSFPDTEPVVSEAEMRERTVENHGAQASTGLIDTVGFTSSENEQMANITTKKMQVSFDHSKILEVENSVDRVAMLAAGNDGMIRLVINNDTLVETVAEMRSEDLNQDGEELTINAEEMEKLVSSTEVSDRLSLSRGSSSVNKVCEALVPPNESESVIIIRIPENAPESTH